MNLNKLASLDDSAISFSDKSRSNKSRSNKLRSHKSCSNKLRSNKSPRVYSLKTCLFIPTTGA